LIHFYKRPENYRSISGTRISSSSPDAGSIDFCINGDKWGVASCCEDPDSGDSEHEPMLGYQSLDEGEKGKEASQHCHKTREEGLDKRAQRKLFLASGICLFFMLGEIVGGVLSNSLAIATDAAHLLTDFAAFLISMLAIWVSARPKSQRMSFGWHRAEVLGATLSVLMIWLITGIIVYMAILRVMHQDFDLDAPVMLITSAIGVCVNLVMGATLHQHGHSHGGGHGHGVKGGKENINVKAAYIHVLGDLAQSVGVFIAALVIYFKPKLKIIDPICSFIFSLIVLGTTFPILRKTLHVLLEATPLNINYDTVMRTFLSVEGIKQVHSLRIWGLTTDKNALNAHLVVQPGLNAQEVLQEATSKMRSLYDFYEMTLQVEEFHEEMSACDQCKDPAN